MSSKWRLEIPVQKQISLITIILVLSVTCGCFLPASSFASIVTYNTQSLFDAQGVMNFNSNFRDYGTGYGQPENHFTRGDVTYNSKENMTWGSSTAYTKTETLIGTNYWTPIVGSIATEPQYNMFGFDIGTWGKSPITINVSTNLKNYTYPSLSIADSLLGQLEFKGFIASSGEYFTGFSIVADLGSSYGLPGITNVALGHSNGSPVPVPSTMLLFASGIAGLAAVGKRKRN